MREREAKSHPDNDEIKRDLSVTREKIGNLFLAEGRIDEAIAIYRESLAAAVDLAKRIPDDAFLQRDLSISYDKLAGALERAGKVDEAVENYRTSLGIRQKIAVGAPDDPRSKIGLYVSYDHIGTAFSKANRHAEALDPFRACVQVLTDLLAMDPANEDHAEALGDSQENVAEELLALDRISEALDGHREALAVRAKLAAAEPRNAVYARKAWLSNLSVGFDLGLLGRNDESLAAYRAGLAQAEALARWAPPGEAWWSVVMSHERVGDAQVALEHEAEAVAEYQQSVALLRKQMALEPGEPKRRANLAAGLVKAGNTLLAFGRSNDAFGLYDEAVRLAPDDPGALAGRGRAALHLGRVGPAADDFAKAVAFKPDDAYPVLWLHIARLRLGQDDDAELSGNAARLDAAEWPQPIIDYDRGRTTVEMLISSVNALDNPQTRINRQCEANFYVGAALAGTDPAAAKPLLAAAVRGCPHGFIEYAGAKLELKALQRTVIGNQ
jgi:tetratricopeptide (TPR) repeat protein